MKICLAVFLLIPFFLFGQAAWDESGVAVRQGDYIDWEKNAVSFGTEIIYVWTDCRRGDSDVWSQKIDDQGNKLWPEDVLVCGETYIQKDIAVTDAGDNSVIIAWFDKRNGWEGDIYAQKLNTNGEILWDPAGVPICVADEEQLNLKILKDTQGGAYIFWRDSRNPGGYDIYCNRVLENGVIAEGWDINGNAVISASGEQNQHSVCIDGNGGTIAVWKDRRDIDNEDLYMQRILPDGTLAWDENGILLCGVEGQQSNPEITIGTDFIFTIIWRDRRSDVFSDIYLQKISSDGQILLPDDVCICNANGQQKNPEIISVENAEIIIVWLDDRYDINSDYYDLFMQKIDAAGIPLWEANGNPLVLADNDQINPDLHSDNNGGCWIAWEDGRIENHPWGDIYIQHLDADGNPLLNPDGLVVCEEIDRQYYPCITFSNNNIVLFWQDKRTGSDEIFTQTIDQNGNILLSNNGVEIQSGISGDVSKHFLLPNGDNPIVIWQEDRSDISQFYMQIINTNGTFVFEENGIPIVANEVSVECPDAIFNSENENIIIVWQCHNPDNYNLSNVYAQAIDLSGNQLWEPEGIRLSSEEIEQFDCQIDYDDEGFYYTGWSDYNGNWTNPVIRISGQKIDTAGNLLWEDEGVVIADKPGDDILQDVAGRYYIWQNENWPNYIIYVKLVNEDGSTAAGWPEDGLAICSEDGTHINPRGFLSDNGLLVIWRDMRSGHEEVYGQLVNSAGEIQWQENGIPLATNEYDAENAHLAYNEDNFYLIWQNYDTDFYDIHLQKFDYSGNPCWTEVVEFGMEGNSKHDPNLVLCDDRIYTIWIERVGDNDFIKAQLLDEFGNKLWIAGGEIVCESIYYRSQPLVVYNGMDNIYNIWRDDRANDYTSFFNLYAQKMYVGETGISNNHLPVNNYHLTNYPNPFNPSTTISFELNTETTENTELGIYNLKGQKVKDLSPSLCHPELVEGRGKKEYSVSWNGKDDNGKQVSSGIYFYKLKSGDFKQTRKMLLLK